jgi:hypothetical protein
MIVTRKNFSLFLMFSKILLLDDKESANLKSADYFIHRNMLFEFNFSSIEARSTKGYNSSH